MRLIALPVVLGTLLAGLGCSREAPWEAPSAGLIARNNASLFYIVPNDTPGVAVFHTGHLDAGTVHTSNPKTRTFNYSGTLTTEANVVVAYEFDSDESSIITIEEHPYDLPAGRVFIIGADGHITQSPFAPPEPSDDYVTRLQEYIDANNAIERTR